MEKVRDKGLFKIPTMPAVDASFTEIIFDGFF
jgi:hypothetical protein